MVNAASFLVGLIGSGIQGSRSPVMHEREGARQRLPYVYRLIDLERLGGGVELLPDLLLAARRMGFDGLNITHPCKQAVIPLLDALSDDARDIGAVNTVVFDGGRMIGHNTDWWGFTESLRRCLPDAPIDTVLQLGAGGAGSATAHALLKLGVGSLLLFDTDQARARALADQLNRRFGGRVQAVADPVQAAARARGLVQATPIGMSGHPGMPLPVEALRPDHWVAEIIYFPLETELLRRARALGCPTVDGSGMAVFQAVGAFELFTGRQADSQAMRKDLLDPSPVEEPRRISRVR